MIVDELYRPSPAVRVQRSPAGAIVSRMRAVDWFVPGAACDPLLLLELGVLFRGHLGQTLNERHGSLELGVRVCSAE